MSGTLVKLVAVVSGSLEYALLGWHASPGLGGLAYGPVSKGLENLPTTFFPLSLCVFSPARPVQ